MHMLNVSLSILQQGLICHIFIQRELPYCVNNIMTLLPYTAVIQLLIAQNQMVHIMVYAMIISMS